MCFRLAFVRFWLLTWILKRVSLFLTKAFFRGLQASQGNRFWYPIFGFKSISVNILKSRAILWAPSLLCPLHRFDKNFPVFSSKLVAALSQRQLTSTTNVNITPQDPCPQTLSVPDEANAWPQEHQPDSKCFETMTTSGREETKRATKLITTVLKPMTRSGREEKQGELCGTVKTPTA